jgi:hypothetical protein
MQKRSSRPGATQKLRLWRTAGIFSTRNMAQSRRLAGHLRIQKTKLVRPDAERNLQRRRLDMIRKSNSNILVGVLESAPFKRRHSSHQFGRNTFDHPTLPQDPRTPSMEGVLDSQSPNLHGIQAVPTAGRLAKGFIRFYEYSKSVNIATSAYNHYILHLFT